jgi:hypothetical protein
MTSLRDGRLGAVLWAAFASAALAATPEVTVHPARVLLGVDPQVEVEVRADDAPRLKASASTGTLSQRLLAGPNVARYVWTPPDVRYPHTAILLFWIEQTAGPPELAVARIPLIGRTDLDVNTEPKAEVRVEVGTRTFGPRRADARGYAQVPVEVPPGVVEAKVLSEVGGVSKAVMVPLGVPPSNHLAAAAGPQVLPRAGGWAWLVSAEPLDLDALAVQATGAAVVLSSSLPDRALFTVRPTSEARKVSMTFRTSRAPEDLVTLGLEVAEPPAAQPHPVASPVLSPGMMLGAAYGGGANLSVFGSVELAISFPPFGTAFAAGLALEANTMGLSTFAPGLGELSSWLVGFAPLAVARLQLFELGPAAFHVRAGVGPILFVHQIRTSFGPSFTESGISLEAFGGVEVSYRVGPLDVFLDGRAALAQVQTPRLDANIGGMMIGLGARIFR